MAYILIIIGLVSLVTGVLMLSKNDKISSSSSVRNNTENVLSDSQELISTTPKIIIKPKIIASQSVDKPLTSNNLIKNSEPKEKTSDDLKIESKMKGDAFEQHVVKRFAPKYFRIKEWRGDKYVDGIYAERTKELWWEGWRRNDMIRFGKFLAIRELKPYVSDNKYILYPIPADALFNANLKQNPGY